MSEKSPRVKEYLRRFSVKFDGWWKDGRYHNNGSLVDDYLKHHRFRQRQQRLKRHGHCGRWDRRYR